MTTNGHGPRCTCTDAQIAAGDQAPTCPHDRRVVTDAQIESLRTAAGSAGDLAQVEICDSALDGSAKDRAECARVISEARA